MEEKDETREDVDRMFAYCFILVHPSSRLIIQHQTASASVIFVVGNEKKRDYEAVHMHVKSHWELRG